MNNKHVIFLGAGASVTSGYPVADQLTILMADPRFFFLRLGEALDSDGESIEDKKRTQLHVLQHLTNCFSQASQLLRSGNFRTMDELSDLAFGGEHARQIRELKKLMRLALALTNPARNAYPKSDYRHFIQGLFRRDATIRNDVSVLSFNNDSFFEWNLLRSLHTRNTLRSVGEYEMARLPQAITSGLLRPNDLNWLEQPGFCHLKLHGACAFPHRTGIRISAWPPQEGESRELCNEHLFAFATTPRFLCLTDPEFAAQHPPILLPWEIVHDDGRLLSESEFTERVGSDWQHVGLYNLFKRIWERARTEVQEAGRISFVGLSFGPFMEPELKYLLQGKAGSVHFVVANPDNDQFAKIESEQGRDFIHPRSLRGRTMELIHRLAPEIRFFGSLSDNARDGHLTARSSFGDFINWEMS